MTCSGRARAQAQPIILFRTANYDPALDWTVASQGTVNDFHAAGLVSAALNLHYHALPAFENEYAPFGVDSGLCLGVAWPSTTRV